MNRKDITIEKLFPSGGLLLYALVNGELVRRRYFDYTRKEAINLFLEEVKS